MQIRRIKLQTTILRNAAKRHAIDYLPRTCGLSVSFSSMSHATPFGSRAISHIAWVRAGFGKGTNIFNAAEIVHNRDGFNRYNADGIPEFDRIHRAVQHFTPINDKGDGPSFVNIMRTGENGDYANTWLLADYRNDSIWEFEEGLEFYNITHKKANDEKPYFFGANYPKYPPIMRLECSNDGG
ncbi:MAG: hypothetical protein LBH85_01250, partial [Treponema sp.]|nr:hypothetical protein [Treponema sp.]